MTIPKELLEILACPKCSGSLEEMGMFIVCKRCKLAYPVLDEEIPDMLIEDVWPLSKAKKSKFKHKMKL